MERCPLVRGLEHVPVWQHVQVLSNNTVVSIAKDVPRMTSVDLGEEVVRVANEQPWLVGWEL